MIYPLKGRSPFVRCQIAQNITFLYLKLAAQKPKTDIL